MKIFLVLASAAVALFFTTSHADPRGWMPCHLRLKPVRCAPSNASNPPAVKDVNRVIAAAYRGHLDVTLAHLYATVNRAQKAHKSTRKWAFLIEEGVPGLAQRVGDQHRARPRGGGRGRDAGRAALSCRCSAWARAPKHVVRRVRARPRGEGADLEGLQPLGHEIERAAPLVYGAGSVRPRRYSVQGPNGRRGCTASVLTEANVGGGAGASKLRRAVWRRLELL